MFLQLEDMKHIKQDFCSDAWVMRQGMDLGGALGAKGRGVIFFFAEHDQLAYQIDRDDE